MKELINRGIFGIIFLLFVFTPYYLDLTNDTDLFNLVLFVFATFGVYELHKIAGNTPYKSNLMIPSFLLNTIFFLPMLQETARSLWPSVPISPMWIWLIEHAGLTFLLYTVVCISVLIFCLIVFAKQPILWIFKGTFFLSFFYVTLPLAIFSLAMTLSSVELKQFLLLVLIPIYLNDTLAYLVGRAIGKHKMIPSVSPKKTWEGFFGGMLGAAGVMLLILFLMRTSYTTPRDYFLLAMLSFAVSILATMGDLFESKLKRAADVKDSGNVLPGHGGILDRIDAMLFAAPVLYVFLLLGLLEL